MSKGGARARSGPAPTSQDRSHKAKAPDTHGWITLPAEGRAGASPAFPLTAPTRREKALWERLWRTPQAVMWDQLGQDIEVASYVRLLAVAEQPESPIVAWAQVKQIAESLGLSVAGMQRNRWTVAKTDDQSASGVPLASVSQVSSLADRLRAVADG